MDPQTGRAFFGLMMSFFVLLVFSLIFMPPGSPSLPLAELGLIVWIFLFSIMVYDIRRQSGPKRGFYPEKRARKKGKTRVLPWSKRVGRANAVGRSG